MIISKDKYWKTVRKKEQGKIVFKGSKYEDK